MRPRLLLVAAFLALLVLPEATRAEEESLLDKVKGYAKDVVQKTRYALTSPPPALPAPVRDWMTESFSSLKDSWNSFKGKFK
ncbi:apolipoprotein C-III-like [Muntiacus reevesi]|uniref:apolipoprotein C-III-like n=1 Tax=Muntiacus reevesi TaxID=9886 RepID=UPI003307C398